MNEDPTPPFLSYGPVREEPGSQGSPSVAGLASLFYRLVSFLPRRLLEECFLEINLGGMHLLKCLAEGLHI
jgi:hypothetical protein